MALLSGNLPRNQIFRERKVRIVLEGFPNVTADAAGPFGRPEQIQVLELTEVKTTSVKTTGSTAIMPGVIVPVIQPWYFQPVTIEVQGESYMGAFAQESLNVTADNDVERLWQLRDNVNALFANSNGSVRGMQVRLAIGKRLGSNASPDREFVGNVDDLRIEESDEKPYLWTYSFSFTGDLSTRADLEQGIKAFRSDIGRTTATKTSGVEVGPPTAPLVN